MAVELYQQPGAAQAPAPPPVSPQAQRERAALLKGRKKAAVLLVTLGSDRASEVFKHLHFDEIETLSLEMAKLQHVEPMVTNKVLEELAATVQAYESLAAGGVDYARDVLERALGSERAAEIIGRLSTVIEMRPFEFLRRTAPEQIVAFLRNEAPQTVALVVANLHTTLAAAVLANHPEEEQAEIALRIAKMGETSPEVVKQVEEVMRAKLATVVQNEYTTTGGVKSLAEILNHTDRPTERNVLDSLTETDEELAAEVRRLLFVFEDIVKLDDRSIQLVLREADQKDLALALRGVSEEVKQRVLQNMSERGAQMLLEEMEYQPPQRKRIVEEAQGRVVAIVRRLEEAGAIVLSRSEADVMF
jgi:flagellar motor switch protein FliG